jgi:hypothetical protein
MMRLVLAAGLVLSLSIAPSLALAAEAEAAMERMIDSQSAVLDTLEEIEDAESLERQSATLMAALTRARRDTDAVAGHAEAFGGSEGLRATLADRLRDYTARRDAVYAGVLDRLDEDALDRLDEIFDAAE